MLATVITIPAVTCMLFDCFNLSLNYGIQDQIRSISVKVSDC